MRKFLTFVAIAAMSLALAFPARALPLPPGPPYVTNYAYGTGLDAFGDRLTIYAGDNFYAGGLGLALVRLGYNTGVSVPVTLTCLSISDRPGFEFAYASGFGADGEHYYIGVFDNNGPHRSGSYDVMYVHTSPVSGPCNVAADGSYPIGWFPLVAGDFVVGPN